MKASVSDHLTARLAAAMASLGAGVIHGAVVPDHLAEWWASGLFFIVLAAFQVLWAPAVVVINSRALLVVGGVVSVGSIGLWAVTRVWGQPAGPQAGVPLPAGPSGVIAGVLELALVVCVVWALRARSARHLRAVTAMSALGAAFAVAVALTVPGVSAALKHDHAAHGAQDGHGHGAGDSASGHHDEPGMREDGHHDGSAPAHDDTRRRTDDGNDDRQSSPAPTRPGPSKSPTGHGHGDGDHSH